MGSPLCVICCFSFAAFNIFSLCLIFVSLINVWVGMFLFGFILYGTLWASWTWVAISFPMLEKVSTVISSNIFAHPFFFVQVQARSERSASFPPTPTSSIFDAAFNIFTCLPLTAHRSCRCNFCILIFMLAHFSD